MIDEFKLNPKYIQAQAQRKADRPYLLILLGIWVVTALFWLAVGITLGWANWVFLPQI